jgi:hypothetical protein
MANINLIQQPNTSTQVYFRNDGTPDGNINLGLDPVDTPIIFGFESETFTFTNLFSEAIISPYLDFSTLLFYGVPSNCRINIFGVTLTSSTNLNLTNTQFQTINLLQAQNNPIERDNFIMSIVNRINGNSNINWRVEASRIEIISGIPVVYLKTKIPGASYSLSEVGNLNINLTGVTGGPLNPNWIPANALIPSQDSSIGMQLQQFNWRFYIDIRKINLPFGRLTLPQNPQLSTSLGRLEKSWTLENNAQFNVAQYLKGQLEYFNPSLNNDFSQLTLIPNQIVAYFIEYGQNINQRRNVNGNFPPLFNQFTQRLIEPINVTNSYPVGKTDVRWATHGVFDLNVQPVPNTPYWLRRDQSSVFNLRFWDNAPANITRRLSRLPFFPWFESFFYHNNFQFTPTRRLRCRVQNELLTGAQLPIRTIGTEVTISESGIYLIDLSENNGGWPVDENFNGQLLQSRIWMEHFINGNWERWTVDRIYNWDLNRDPRSNYTRIYWRNKLGMISQFDFEGFKSDQFNRDIEEYETPINLSPGINLEDGQRQILITTINQRTTVNSGWIGVDEFTWLREISESNDVWVIEPIEYVDRRFSDLSLQPVIEWEFKKIIITRFNWEKNNLDKIFNIQVEFELSQQINTRVK